MKIITAELAILILLKHKFKNVVKRMTAVVLAKVKKKREKATYRNGIDKSFMATVAG